MGGRLKGYIPEEEKIRHGLSITIRDYDIQRAIYLIITFNTDLAMMVNRYSVNYYGDLPGIRKDAY